MFQVCPADEYVIFRSTDKSGATDFCEGLFLGPIPPVDLWKNIVHRLDLREPDFGHFSGGELLVEFDEIQRRTSLLYSSCEPIHVQTAELPSTWARAR